MKMIFKTGLFLSSFFLVTCELFAQGIGISSSTTVTPNPSSMLDITAGNANSRGLLIPRVTAAQRLAIGSSTPNNPLPQAAQGLMVYQTDNAAPGEGIYFNISTTLYTNWVKVGSTAWGLLGNSATSAGTNFLGTTDAQGLDIRTSNITRMSILSGGNVGIGATNPSMKLSVGGNGPSSGFSTTDMWIENNLHVQGNETVGAGRGRLRVGTAWGYVGLYAESNSAGANNDLILGASSNVVRIGPGGTAHKLLLPSNTGFQMVDGGGTLKIMLSDGTGNGTWQPISAAMQIYTQSATQTNISTACNTYQDVTGLSQTLTLTGNSYIVINTTGSLESDGASGTYSQCTVSLQRTDTGPILLQEQATDIINANGISQVVHHWAISHTLTLGAGTYTFKVRACKRGGQNFDAGGADTTSLPSDGALSIEVYPQ